MFQTLASSTASAGFSGFGVAPASYGFFLCAPLARTRYRFAPLTQP